jgi:hypothetical protein
MRWSICEFAYNCNQLVQHLIDQTLAWWTAETVLTDDRAKIFFLRGRHIDDVQLIARLGRRSRIRRGSSANLNLKDGHYISLFRLALIILLLSVTSLHFLYTPSSRCLSSEELRAPSLLECSLRDSLCQQDGSHLRHVSPRETLEASPGARYVRKHCFHRVPELGS